MLILLEPFALYSHRDQILKMHVDSYDSVLNIRTFYTGTYMNPSRELCKSIEIFNTRHEKYKFL